MMSCLCHANVKQTMMSGVQATQTPMISCHLIPTWQEWNTNATDIMITWFALYANQSDITSGMHNTCTHAWHMCSM